MTLDELERPKRSLAEKNRFISGWKSGKLMHGQLAQPNTFALGSPKAIRRKGSKTDFSFVKHTMHRFGHFLFTNFH